MKKLIVASEKKITAIGTRLIHAAKDRVKEDFPLMGQRTQRDDDSSSTVKIRSD